MSSYDCVLPVSWPRLTQNVLPKWCRLLEGDWDAEAFAREFTPRYVASEEKYGGVTFEADFYRPVPDGYLRDICWRGDLPFAADNLRWSELHRNIGGGWPDFLCYFIKEQAGAELAGADHFVDEEFGYWGTLHDAPHIQVAGFKNGPRFLECLYKTEWDQQLWLTRWRQKMGLPPELHQLIRALFLNTRALPASDPVKENDAWSVSDHQQLQGYLSPQEVGRLVLHLDTIAQSRHNEPDYNSDHDLFPLLEDRVRRASESGLGLVTLISGL